MKKSVLILIALLLAATLTMTACSNKSTSDEGATTAAVASVISDEQAKAVALDKAGITESAAENLVITESEYEGTKAFVVSFEWSGFEYEITVSAVTGNIVHYIFNGDEMSID